MSLLLLLRSEGGGAGPVIVSTSATFASSVRNSVSTTKTAASSVRNLASQSAALAFSVRNLAATSAAAAFSVRNTASATFDAAYSVLGAAIVQASFTAAYSVRNLASTTRASAFSIRNLAAGEFSAAWMVEQGFVRVEALRSLARGSGRQYTDDDIRALVEAKWEAIEAGRLVQQTPVPSTRPAPRVEKTAEIEQVGPVRAIEVQLPGAAPVVGAPLLPGAAERAREARRRNDEEALILMLAELL